MTMLLEVALAVYLTSGFFQALLIILSVQPLLNYIITIGKKSTQVFRRQEEVTYGFAL